MAPLVLGIVSRPDGEEPASRSRAVDGDLMPFVTRPISAVIAATIVLIVLFRFEWMRRLFAPLFSRGAAAGPR